MASFPRNKYTEFYNAYLWTLEDEVKRHENLAKLLEQQGSTETRDQILLRAEVARARLDTCKTMHRHAVEEMERIQAYAVDIEQRLICSSLMSLSSTSATDFEGSLTSTIQRKTANVPASSSSMVTRKMASRDSTGLKVKVNDRVTFLDPKSGFYVDGVVVSIRSAQLVEVGYYGSRWSHPKYNQIVPVDSVRCKI